MRKHTFTLFVLIYLLSVMTMCTSRVENALEEGQREMFGLLKEWCDALVEHQLTHASKHIDGGLICPGCGIMHGRAADAIYPLLYMANQTGNQRYMQAAEQVFTWAETNVAAPDSSWFNDVNLSAWKGITVFNVIVIGEALKDFGHLLDKGTYNQWLNSMQKQASFVYKVVKPGYGNVNYPVSTPYALTLAAEFTKEEKYKTRASELAHAMLDFFTPNNFFVFGEGDPYVKSPKGLLPVDLGYNVEETLANLLWYANEVGDEAIKQKVKQSMDTHLEFMLPDGAWDNSWGTRNYKWSYWGSRTSDGCIALCNMLGREYPVYTEVGYRNFELLRECTVDGLLAGGMHYASAGYPPCIHHTFEHAKSLAVALQHGFAKPESRMRLPVEEAYGAKYFRDLDLWIVATTDWRATITGYDVDYRKTGGNAHGGTMSLLWNTHAGPIFAAAMTDYSLIEPANMQMQKGLHNYTATFHVSCREKGKTYSSIPFRDAKINHQKMPDGEKVVVHTELQTIHYEAPESGRIPIEIVYLFKDGEVTIHASVSDNHKSTELKLFIPLISNASEKYYSYEEGFCIEKKDCNLHVSSLQGNMSVLPVEENGRVFNPVPGFEFIPFEIAFTKEVTLKINTFKK